MIYTQKTFWIGVVIRLCLIFSCFPIIRTTLFIPFVQSAINNLSFNPWHQFLFDNPTSLSSFPYGITMILPILLAYLPISLAKGFVSSYSIVNTSVALVVLLFDWILLLVLRKLVDREKQKQLTLLYWLSPIVIYINYLHGQLDIIPVVYLLVSLLLIKFEKPALSGLFFSFAASAKLSMLIALPVLLIYLYRNNRVAHLANKFSLTMMLSSLVLIGPLSVNPYYNKMVVFNTQVFKVLDLSLTFGDGINLHLLPIVFIMFIYFILKKERLNQQLILSLIGISFTIFLAMTPSSIGWYLWISPFIVMYLVNRNSKFEVLFYFTLSVFFMFSGFLFYPNSLFFGRKLEFISVFYNSFNNVNLYSDWLTFLAAILAVTAIQMYFYTIRKNPHYFLSKLPVAIGIAGDSGSGKDTLADAIEKLFPKKSTINISGDDYHKWDRYSPMWSTITHLNPMANNLNNYATDVLLLADGLSIKTQEYDHIHGRFTKKNMIKKKDAVIASGLHTLTLTKLLKRLDVKIYLDMDENLRVYFKLKRDIKNRGHDVHNVLASIERRRHDSEKYVKKQSVNADVIFCLKPIHPIDPLALLEKKGAMIQLLLQIILSNDAYHDDLTTFLISNCQCHVTTEILGDGMVKIEVLSEIDESDVKIGAEILASDVLDLLSLKPSWESGFLGVMQLVTLLQLNQKIKSRELV